VQRPSAQELQHEARQQLLNGDLQQAAERAIAPFDARVGNTRALLSRNRTPGHAQRRAKPRIRRDGQRQRFELAVKLLTGLA